MKSRSLRVFLSLLLFFIGTGALGAVYIPGQGSAGNVNVSFIPQALDLPVLSSTPPNPAPSRIKVYDKLGTIYTLDHSGTESALAGGGGGGTYLADEATLHLATDTFSIKAGGVNNTQIGASAGILLSKLVTGTAYRLLANNSSGVPAELTALTASRVLCSDSNGSPTACTVSSSNLPSKADNLSVFAATSSLQLAGVLSDETGSGAAVFGTSPTLVTPVLGVATATSINKVVITAPATSATLGLANGSTLATSGAFSITLTSTATTSVTLPTSGTLLSTASTIDAAQLGVSILASSVGGTGNGFTKFTGATTSEKTFTLPNASATVLTTNAAVTVGQGGTGVSSLAAHGMLLGNGTSPIAIATPGPSGQVWTSNGISADPSWQAASGGGTVDIGLQRGRLSISTGVARPVADVSGATSVFWVPAYAGGVALWDGSAWQNYALTEKSIKLTDAQSCTTTSGSAVIACTDASQLIAGEKVTGANIQASSVISSVSGNNVTLDKTASGSAANTITFKLSASTVLDFFAYQNSGTPKLRMIAWTNSTTRATALDCATGVCYTSGDSTYRFLGSGQVDATDGQMSLSGINCSPAAGGTLANIPLWNQDNREELSVCAKDTTDSWSHANNSIWAAANGSATMRARFVLGRIGLISADYYGTANISGAGVAGVLGVGLNSTTANAGHPGYLSNASFISDGAGVYKGLPALGSNYVQAIDYAAGGSGVTFYGDAAQPTVAQNQITLTGRF